MSLAKEIQIAKENYIKLEQTEVRAKFIYYSPHFDTLSFKLNNEVLIIIPKNLISEIKNIENKKLFDLWSTKKLYLSGNGSSLHCDELNIDLSVNNLIMDLFTKSNSSKSKYYAEIGRKGGQSKSEKKINAARENGKKGGRPKRSTETKY